MTAIHGVKLVTLSDNDGVATSAVCSMVSAVSVASTGVVTTYEDSAAATEGDSTTSGDGGFWLAVELGAGLSINTAIVMTGPRPMTNNAAMPTM